MAVFKIISSQSGDDKNNAVFGIQLLNGEVVVGDEFRCYDTHHPVDYRVQEVRGSVEVPILFCDGFYGYDEFFLGAIIDTTKRGKPFGFHDDVT